MLEDFDLTQDELANELSISRELINRMANDRSVISHKTLAKIAEYRKNHFVKNSSHAKNQVGE